MASNSISLQCDAGEERLVGTTTMLVSFVNSIASLSPRSGVKLRRVTTYGSPGLHGVVFQSSALSASTSEGFESRLQRSGWKLLQCRQRTAKGSRGICRVQLPTRYRRRTLNLPTEAWHAYTLVTCTVHVAKRKQPMIYGLSASRNFNLLHWRII